MGCFGPDSPNQRNYSQELGDTLNTQEKLAPEWFSLENQYQPKYAALAQRTQQQALPGQLSMLGQSDRYVSNLRRSLDPTEAGLMDTLSGQASSDLALGTDLSPAQQRLATQGVRAGFADRGLGYGPSDAFSEALGQMDYGTQLQAQRRNFASGVAGQRNAIYGDPFQEAMGVMGSASGQRGGPSLFNPESAYAGNLANYNAATDWQFKQASPSTMARVGMVSNTLGSFIGSVAGGAMGCWVARAVYGNGDKRWLVFRGWMLNEAPAWFRKLYFKFGPTWAKWVKKSNLLKWVIKLAMDRVVERRQVCPVLDQHQ